MSGAARLAWLAGPEAEGRAAAAAGWLADRGLGQGDRFALVATPSVDVVAVVAGALRSGVFPVMVNPVLTAAEQEAIMADARVAVVVDDAGVAAAVAHPSPAELDPHPRGRPVHYTSGTTGRSKGVWSGLLDAHAARAQVDDEAGVWGIGNDDRHLVTAPLAHSAPLRFALTTWARGGAVAVLPRFDPGLFTDAVTELHPTATFLAPVHLRRLVDHWGESPPDLSSFRLVAHAGSPCPAAVKAAAVELFPTGAVHEFYGSTEGQFTVSSEADWQRHPGSVGRARPGREVRAGPDGRLWCRPPAHARFEYWGDPEATAAAWDGDWFTVGDLGRVDADGYVFIEGRRDDLVISGGVNVYPAEVERVLAECPGVIEAAVFGADDPEWGQRVCAAVVGTATADAVSAHAAAHLAPFKRPKLVLVVGDLPRTATGKVVARSRLASMLLGPDRA